MSPEERSALNRRQFLETTTAAAGAACIAGAAGEAAADVQPGMQ